MSLSGKTIAITGAARGLGQEFARHLATLGANIVVGDVNDCGATAKIVKEAGGKVVAVALDVTDPASARAMADAAVAEFGRLDGLVNNAALYGALKGGRFDGIPESEWDACMAVNVKGIWNCCKAASSGWNSPLPFWTTRVSSAIGGTWVMPPPRMPPNP